MYHIVRKMVRWSKPLTRYKLRDKNQPRIASTIEHNDMPDIHSKVKSNDTNLSFPKDACHRLLERTQNKLDLCTGFLPVSNPQYDVDLLSSRSEKKLLLKKAIAALFSFVQTPLPSKLTETSRQATQSIVAQSGQLDNTIIIIPQEEEIYAHI
ncbi:hypothetical protein A0J61_11531 [Choanephora cucurbitarum]|uniref:Uncharacterized protein n=1 Tax=Choanephora cucurbitarum TaxID=101091 RepID=A0A1C7MUA1_9FUNG|nr:hypothetical protein A0J61_11531 [Choanephora cucurbitarum]